MSKKNKGNNRKTQVMATPPLVQQKEVSASNVISSPSETDFEKNKTALIKQFEDDIKRYEDAKSNAEKAAEEARKHYEELEAQKDSIEKQKEELQKEFAQIQAEYDDAVSTIEKSKKESELIKSQAETDALTIKSMAEEDAKATRECAEKERLEKISKAADEAREAWKNQIEDIKKQIEGISKKEKAIHDAQMLLDKDRQDFDFEKEELDEMIKFVQKQKIRYSEANPAKIEELEIEIRDEKSKYEMLLLKYDTLSKRFEETQVLLDSIKTEIEDSDGGKKLTSMSEIVSTMQAFKDKYEKLARIYSKYPDDNSINLLEEKSQKFDCLEKENFVLGQERNRYREEAQAAKNASKELEVIRQEVEATNALNEHLLQELESHKTALESRTGDTCPSLSKVDSETEEEDFKKDISDRIQRNSLTSLPEIVTHVKNFAGSRVKGEQLYYKDNDIRAFLAGMAVSRLIILQGMSGTGKSSLPRIFSESISGFNRLIPVESSWRDRNELLGYYNDFNKKFNAKSFTIELYRSSKKRCQDIPTFIVLDEMNLARIEYYFSDFLAILQEPNPDKWLIELMASDMRTLPMELPDEIKQKIKKEAPSVFAVWEKIEKSRSGDLKVETSDEEKEELTAYLGRLGRLTGAKDLISGRKIRVSNNIWFVGTANQDESTFEISDKVYDRAQIVSLNSKGQAEERYENVVERYISVADLQELFDIAIRDNKYETEVKSRLDVIDSILIDKFKVSFGNRIVSQTIDFVAVFIAAGGKLDDALDYQISTKIIRKVISSDNEKYLSELLEATKNYHETYRIIKNRIEDLE